MIEDPPAKKGTHHDSRCQHGVAGQAIPGDHVASGIGNRHDALTRIESMDWWGVGMLEYRYAGGNDFHLMEFNARFWGSLHLALFAGVDFPRLLIEVWQGRDVQPVRATTGVRCRLTFPKELEYLWSLIRDPDVGRLRKAKSLVEAVALSIDPRVHNDFWFPGDRTLYWEALRRTPARLLRKA